MERDSFFLHKRPEGVLSRHIQCFWISRSPRASVPSRFLLLPDGGTEIVFNLGDPERVWHGRDGDDWGVVGGSRLIAGRKDFLFLEPTGSKFKIGVRFFPGGLHPFAPIPLDEMPNAIIDLADVLGGECREMEDRLFHAKDAAAAFDVLQRKVLFCYDPDFREDGIVDRLIRRIRRSRGRISLRMAASRWGLDVKSVRRRFTARIGFTPKQYGRIVRFHALLKALGKGGSDSWASLACQFGFYDQSHFIKEFESFTGMAPSRFLSSPVPIIR